jgi:hypothetical protein
VRTVVFDNDGRVIHVRSKPCQSQYPARQNKFFGFDKFFNNFVSPPARPTLLSVLPDVANRANPKMQDDGGQQNRDQPVSGLHFSAGQFSAYVGSCFVFLQ